MKILIFIIKMIMGCKCKGNKPDRKWNRHGGLKKKPLPKPIEPPKTNNKDTK